MYNCHPIIFRGVLSIYVVHVVYVFLWLEAIHFSLNGRHEQIFKKLKRLLNEFHRSIFSYSFFNSNLKFKIYRFKYFIWAGIATILEPNSIPGKGCVS